MDGKRIGTKVNFIRYADDFIITGTSREMLEKEVMPAVEGFMRERGLPLSPEKTKITHIAEGFNFLGQNVRKYNGKLLIKPSKTNVKAFLGKIRLAIKGNRTATQINLIGLLNPMIKGWADYHRHVVSKKSLQRSRFADMASVVAMVLPPTSRQAKGLDQTSILSLYRWPKQVLCGSTR